MDAFAHWLAPFLSGGSLLALPLVLVGGLITAFNPCCLPMYPAVFGFFGQACCSRTRPDAAASAQTHPPPLTGVTVSFVLGMAAATSLMGILTAALGWVFGRFGTVFLMLLAAIPLLMGLHLLGLLPIRLPAWHGAKLHALAESNTKRKLAAFGTGMVFSMAIAPCATPILLGILTLVAMKGNLAYGGVLLFLYGLGSGVPALAVGFGLGGSHKLLTMRTNRKWLQRISGLLLIGSSLYIVWGA